MTVARRTGPRGFYAARYQNALKTLEALLKKEDKSDQI